MSMTPGDPLEPRTEPLGDAPPPPPPPPTASEPTPRRLTRSVHDRMLGGVAGGLGRHFGIDPVIFRIGFVAGAFLGGLGAFLYVAALLFVPDDAGGTTPFDRSKVLTVAGAAILAIVALNVLNSGGFVYQPIVPLALLAGLGYVVYRTGRARSGEQGSITLARVVTWSVVGTGAALALAALSVGSAWAAAEGSGSAVAAAVIALGVATVVLALRPGHRSRWLVLPALAMAVPLGVVAAADVSFDGGFGNQTYRPAQLADLPSGGYRIGAGDLEVDLRRLDFSASPGTSLDVGVGMGHALVRVPAGVCVRTGARIGAGGIGVAGRWSGGLDLEDASPLRIGGPPALAIRGDVGLGSIEVVAGDYPSPADYAHEGRVFGLGDADPTAACGAKEG